MSIYGFMTLRHGRRRIMHLSLQETDRIKFIKHTFDSSLPQPGYSAGMDIPARIGSGT